MYNRMPWYIVLLFIFPRLRASSLLCSASPITPPPRFNSSMSPPQVQVARSEDPDSTVNTISNVTETETANKDTANLESTALPASEDKKRSGLKFLE